MRLEAYVSRESWGSWHAGRGALYNVEHGYYELALADIDDIAMLGSRVEHVLEKAWCGVQEADDLFRALEDLLGAKLELDYGPSVSVTSFTGQSRLPVITERLRRSMTLS